MVKILSPKDKEAIVQAVREAEGKTSAELVAVVSAASDHYLSFVLFYGLTIGSLVAIALWTYQPATTFPMLLAVQLGIVLLFLLLRPLRRLCICLVPQHIRHQRAAHRAFEEYQHIAQHVAASTPIVLFYVSLAERYVHILPSRLVREKIPGTIWEDVVREFTAALPQKGLQSASIQTIQRITGLLVPHFPPQGKTQHLRHPVIETGKE